MIARIFRAIDCTHGLNDDHKTFTPFGPDPILLIEFQTCTVGQGITVQSNMHSEPMISVNRTAPPDEFRQTVLDHEHLRLLSFGYVISGGLSAFFSLLGLMYAFMGLVLHSIFSAAHQSANGPVIAPPPEIAWFLGMFGLVFFVFMASMAALKLRAAWCLKRRRSRTFCLVIAGISCISIPYGTLLGVCTFLVLGRASTKTLFDVQSIS